MNERTDNEALAQVAAERARWAAVLAPKKPSHVPELEAHCGSWVVTRKACRTVVGEFFSRANVERFNPATCLIETAAQYLGRINSRGA